MSHTCVSLLQNTVDATNNNNNNNKTDSYSAFRSEDTEVLDVLWDTIPLSITVCLVICRYLQHRNLSP